MTICLSIPTTYDREDTAYGGQESTFPGTNSNERFKDQSWIPLESDSGHLLICKEQLIRYHKLKCIETYMCRDYGIMIWAGISQGDHTNMYVFLGKKPTGVRYRDEIHDPYIRPYADAIGNNFILVYSSWCLTSPSCDCWELSWRSQFGVNGLISSHSRSESYITPLGLSCQTSYYFMISSKVIRWSGTRITLCPVLAVFRYPMTLLTAWKDDAANSFKSWVMYCFLQKWTFSPRSFFFKVNNFCIQLK